MGDLIDRLRAEIRQRQYDSGDMLYLGAPDPLLTEAADEIAALRERVAELEEMLVAEREDNLWNAYNVGHVRDGKWNHLCMSDGEWLARECGFNVSDCRFDDEEIRNAIPKAARAILSKQDPEYSGRVEVVDEGETARAAIAAIGGDRG